MHLTFFFLLCFATAVASHKDHIFSKCSDDLYHSSSSYEFNLRNLLTNLTALTLKSPLLYSAISNINVFGFAQCRPDSSSITCADCLLNSSSKLLASGGNSNTSDGCGQSISAAVYQDSCLLRYSNRKFSFLLNQELVGSAYSEVNSSNIGNFSQRVVDLMKNIALKASMLSEKFVVGVEAGDAEKQKIYGMVWCSWDMTSENCYKCLSLALLKLNLTVEGGRLFEYNCLLRFEVYLFFDIAYNKTMTPMESAAAKDDGQESSKRKMLLSIVIIVGVASVFSTIIIIVVLKKAKLSIVAIRLDANEEASDKSLLLNFGIIKFDANEEVSDKSLLLNFGIINTATSNFSEACKLGEGGFGPVYKGILTDGQEIAVKRMSRTSGQGVVELKNEVTFLAKLQHRNLVRLVGFCMEKKEKILVYEFLPNTSLDKLLFDPVRKIQLDWGTRYKIIEGIAQGLLYLHEDSRVKVIHCDLKASNILLDSDMNPKISDFGLAKLFGIDESQGNTSRILGTHGYMAPEYVHRGHFSTKSDVYSYGVLVLEIVTGHRNICLDESMDSVDLLRFIWQKWKQNKALQAVDQTLGDRYLSDQVLRCLQIGLLCIQEDPTQRPSMASIVFMLSSYSLSLPEPLIPAFLR